MRRLFLFSGGPLDGSSFPFDPDKLQPLDDQFGGKAWLDTGDGKIGRQFTVQNPNTPTDADGTVWEFRQHRYEVTERAADDSKVVIRAKHICGMPGSRAIEYDRKYADFIKMLAETIDETIVVHHPEVIGDNYEEIVESLNRLADAGKKLIVVPRKERK